MLRWIRPKDVHQHYEESQKLFALPSHAQCKEKTQHILSESYLPDPASTVQVSPHVLQDAQLLDALAPETPTDGNHGNHGNHGGEWIRHQVQHPIHSIPQLKQRQADIQTIRQHPHPHPHPHPSAPASAATAADVLWALDLPPLNKSWPLPLLFPQWFALRWVNHQPTLLNLYHLYRIYGAPLSHLIYPITLFFGPWWYIRTKLNWKIPLKVYIGFIKKALVELMKIRTRDIREIFIKLTTIVVYVGLYVYGLIQSLDIAYMLHQTRRVLLDRISRIHAFIETTQSQWAHYGFTNATLTTWNVRSPLSTIPDAQIPRLSTSIQGIHQLFHTPRFHPFLKHILLQSYTLQGLQTIANHPATFRIVRWRSASAKASSPMLKFTGMGHPMLSSAQQRNTALLSKNLILTGPNAAGKSTFVRGILANILMAQTFGVSDAHSATVSPVHTLASLMRVQDVVGTQSLFEAECRRSLELIRYAQENHPMILFLDEPMNATPPIEGAATAMALVKYLSQFPHVRLIVTTHYHVLSNLETLYPARFRNVSMEASTQPIQFTYKLRSGPSFQSIAIEMLEKDAFPEELLKDAIEFKNKICRVEDNTSKQ